MNPALKPPRAPHGQRLLITQIHTIARTDPERPWISVPVDDSDLSKGFKDVTYKEFVSGANIAARWLRENLHLTGDGFPAFTYVGPKDLRYLFFALAAGKLGYQMIIPAPTITVAGQQRIMEQKNCQVYLYAEEQATLAREIKEGDKSTRIVAAPGLGYFTKEDKGSPVEYEKSWPDGEDDPWLVFHTSGTTGFPKVVTYTQRMLSIVDIAAGLDCVEQTHLAQYRNSRSYAPVAIMHYVSMNMILGVTTFGNAVPVMGPADRPPSPAIVKQILKYTHVDGATLSPALIDGLCRDEESLELIRKLKYIKYAGAPISTNSGELLASHVHLSPAIGSTEAGAYFTSLPNVSHDWDYVVFEPHAGTVMEHRAGDMYELVYIRNPECFMQTIFNLYPHLDRFETKDLWIEHPSKKGHWKIVGRDDDFIKLANGNGLFATPIEAVIAEHPHVQNAIVGGHGRPKPVLLIELIETDRVQSTTDEGRASLVKSLQPLLEKANKSCPESIQLDNGLIVFATPEKPWPRTSKDTVIRSQTLKLYKDEISNAYERADG